IRVVFYTATYRVAEALEVARSCGVDFVLPKPSDPQQILTAVGGALGVGATTRPLPDTLREPQPIVPLADKLGAYLHEVEALNDRLGSVIEQGHDLAGERQRLRDIAAELKTTVLNLQSMSLRLTSLVEVGVELASERDPEVLLRLFCRAARNV